MIGTASVTVTRLKTHPLYLKGQGGPKLFGRQRLGGQKGDVVVMESTRPLSRAKSWKIISIKAWEKA